jgi:hypothetical protein
LCSELNQTALKEYSDSKQQLYEAIQPTISSYQIEEYARCLDDKGKCSILFSFSPGMVNERLKGDCVQNYIAPKSFLKLCNFASMF